MGHEDYERLYYYYYFTVV